MEVCQPGKCRRTGHGLRNGEAVSPGPANGIATNHIGLQMIRQWKVRMNMKVVGRNTVVPAAPRSGRSGPAAPAASTKVIHSTILSELDTNTQVTLIVHSETMSDQHVSMLHDNCLEALRRATRSVCEKVAAA